MFNFMFNLFYLCFTLIKLLLTGKVLATGELRLGDLQPEATVQAWTFGKDFLYKKDEMGDFVTRNLCNRILWVCTEIESAKDRFPRVFLERTRLRVYSLQSVESWCLGEAGSSGFTGTSTFYWLFMKIKAPNIPSHSIPSSYFNVCMYDKSNLASLLNDPPDINTFGRPVLYIRTLNRWPIFFVFLLTEGW